MSISSDVYITRLEAKEMVKRKLMAEQERLVELAVNGMDKWDLGSHLHNELYFYHVEGDDNDE